MAEKRKILEPVGTPSFSKREAVKTIRQLKEERRRKLGENRARRKK